MLEPYPTYLGEHKQVLGQQESQGRIQGGGGGPEGLVGVIGSQL